MMKGTVHMVVMTRASMTMGMVTATEEAMVHMEAEEAAACRDVAPACEA